MRFETFTYAMTTAVGLAYCLTALIAFTVCSTAKYSQSCPAIGAGFFPIDLQNTSANPGRDVLCTRCKFSFTVIVAGFPVHLNGPPISSVLMDSLLRYQA